MSLTGNFFIRQAGTDMYVKFRPDNPSQPFKTGKYVLADGIAGAAVFDAWHAMCFIRGIHDIDLEKVDAIVTVNKEIAKNRRQ